MATTSSALGARFTDALAAKDAAGLAALFDPAVDFRAVTPGRAWEASTPAEVVDIVLGHWFPEEDALDELVETDSDAFADRERVAYRFRGHNADGPFLVEQQAYLTERDGRIAWMRVVCSGFRPLA